MYDHMKVGLGICCYERPSFSRNAIQSAFLYLRRYLDVVVLYDDGSVKHQDEYNTLFAEVQTWDWGIPLIAFQAQKNQGVAVAKNFCLKEMMSEGSDYLFLMEDDMTVTSHKAITGYIDASKETGVEHFNFAYHGPMNMAGPVELNPPIEIHGACVGAWSFYTRNAINVVGYMDEKFFNAWEHVDWTARCAKAGLTTPFWKFADVCGAVDWVVPQDHALESSVIRSNPDWAGKMLAGQAYLVSKDPELWR